MIKRLMTSCLAALVLVLALAAPSPVRASDSASGVYGDRIVFGDDFTLASDETITGNLVVFGGDVVVEDGARVTENVVVFGGSVRIAGEVGQNVTVFGGRVDLLSTAVVDGELATVGGSASRETGAEVRGGESQGLEIGRNWNVDRPSPFQPLWTLFSIISGAVAAGVLALLVVLFWPDHTARVSAAALNAPGLSAGLGLLTALGVPVLIVLLAITLCLIPLSLIGGLGLAAASLLGWIALGTVVGARLTAALRWHNLSPAVSAGLGASLFTLATNIIGQVPCIGWVVPTALGLVGLGAVVLTRFGTQPYLGGGVPAWAAPTPPAPPSAPIMPAPPAPEPPAGPADPTQPAA